MRYGELEQGIDVLDGDGNLVGSSRIAARHVGRLGARGLVGRLWLVCPKLFHSPGVSVLGALALTS